MAKKDENKSCCTPANMGCCKVESVITVDERGKMVLPKEIRDKACIHSLYDSVGFDMAGDH